MKITTIRLVLSNVATENLYLEQLDVKTSFLHGDLAKDIYMTQLEGFQSTGKEENLVCSEMAEITKFKRQLSQVFEMKDLGFAKHILDMSIIRDKTKGNLRLYQEKYIGKVLEKFNMKDAEARCQPLGDYFKLSKKQAPKTEASRRRMAKVPYASAVGRVMYAMVCTRPDIAHAVGVVSRFMSNPGREHWEAVKWLLCYLKVGDTTISWMSRIQKCVAMSTTKAKYMAIVEAGKELTFNWETATYCKVYCEDFDSFTDFEADFPVIVYNDALTSGENVLSEPTVNMALPQRDQRHPYLRFEGLEYTNADIHTFEVRLERIFRRQIHRVQVLDFAGLIKELRDDMDTRLRMVHSDEQGQDLFVSDAWRRLLDIRGPLVREWVLEFFSTCRPREEALSSVDCPQHCWERHAKGRKSGAQMFGGHFIARLANHFGLLTEAGLQGPERQQAAAAGTPEGVKGAHVIDEGIQAILAPVQSYQPPPAAAGLRGVVERSITDQARLSTWMISCMTQLMDASGRTYHAFDNTLVSSSQMPYQRRTRRRTDDANTSIPQQPDP
ncbi:retrovirus-related pol polyprotein from transposon TNT 1-94 [Tanacetum coccineum]